MVESKDGLGTMRMKEDGKLTPSLRQEASAAPDVSPALRRRVGCKDLRPSSEIRLPFLLPTVRHPCPNLATLPSRPSAATTDRSDVRPSVNSPPRVMLACTHGIPCSRGSRARRAEHRGARWPGRSHATRHRGASGHA